MKTAIMALGLLVFVGCSRNDPPPSSEPGNGVPAPSADVWERPDAHLVDDPVSAVREALPHGWEILKVKENTHPPYRPEANGRALFLGIVGKKHVKIQYDAALYIMPPGYQDGGVDPLNGKEAMTDPARLLAVTADARLYLRGGGGGAHQQKAASIPLADVLRNALIESPESAQERAEALPNADRIWVGPMPFTSGRVLRDDFFPTLSDASKWPTVLRRTDVFKSYIMVLPSAPLPKKQKPQLSDDQLRKLALLLKERQVKVAFEVGGLRIAPGQKAKKGAWGKEVAANEFTHLKRWLDAGGRIDYLTTDHPVMMNLGHRTYKGTDSGLTLEETLEELASYYAEMARRIPNVKFGTIESLGFFHVKGPDGVEYPRTVPKLPIWRFEEFFDLLLAAMKRHGLKLDHFHIDYGYYGVRHDGHRLRKAGLDFGRLLAVERYVQSKGVNVGVIVNAFHDRSVKEPESEQVSREATRNTVGFHAGYLTAGGKAEHMVIQTWHPYPDRTGPEDEPFTVLNLVRDIILRQDRRNPPLRTREKTQK